MGALAIVPTPAATLYELEETLAALVDTAEMVKPEDEAAFLEQFQEALLAAREKRDAVGRFLAFCESQIDFATAEIERLKARKDSYKRAKERLESYVIRTIEGLGTDGKGKFRKLDGNATTLGIRANPPAVQIDSEGAIPMIYKRIAVAMPLVVWQAIVAALPEAELAEVSRLADDSTVYVDKVAIRAALKAGDTVDGARLVCGRRLERS